MLNWNRFSHKIHLIGAAMNIVLLVILLCNSACLYSMEENSLELLNNSSLNFDRLQKIQISQSDLIITHNDHQNFNINTPFITEWNNQVTKNWSQSIEHNDQSVKIPFLIFKTILQAHITYYPNRLFFGIQDWTAILMHLLNKKSSNGTSLDFQKKYLLSLIGSNKEDALTFYNQW